MFIKHYAPNRCEPSIEVIMQIGWVGGCQGGSEQRIEVFVKIPKKKIGGGGGWGGGLGYGGGSRVGVDENASEVIVQIQKKIGEGGGGWGGEGSGGCDRRIEVFGKLHKKKQVAQRATMLT